MEKIQRMDLLEGEEGCNLQPLFSSPISITQVSTRPGLNSGAELAGHHRGALSIFSHTPPHTPILSRDCTQPGGCYPTWYPRAITLLLSWPLDPFPPPWPALFVSLVS